MKHLNWYVRNSQHYVISINRKSRVWRSTGQMTKRVNTFPTSTLQTYVLQTTNGTRKYFVNQTEVFKWFEVISGQSVESITEILAIAEQRKDENDNSFCNIYEYAAG